MKGFKNNIEKLAKENEDFRRVLYTAKHFQLVLISLKPGESIGVETHKGTDQFFRVDAGSGMVMIDGVEQEIGSGDAIIVPAGAEHNITNTSDTESLSLYTIYAPPHHRDGVVHATKADAQADKEHFDGITSE